MPQIDSKTDSAALCDQIFGLDSVSPAMRMNIDETGSLHMMTVGSIFIEVQRAARAALPDVDLETHFACLCGIFW